MEEASGVTSALHNAGYYLKEGLASDELANFVAPLGPFLKDPRDEDDVRDISPQSIKVARPNTLSYRHGDGIFPFHTEAAHWIEPPSFLVLYCLQPGQGGRPTHVQDFGSWDLTEEGKSAVLREVWKFGHLTPRLGTMGCAARNHLTIRYDEACMVPMTRGAEALKESIAEKICEAPKVDIYWKEGMLLILDNRRLLHSRGAAIRPDPDRVIRRILIGGAVNDRVGFRSFMAQGKMVRRQRQRF